MASNQVSLTRMMLNIAKPQDQGLSLARGEILKGVVQDVRADGLVMIMLKGQLIEAASEVMVKPGEQLYLVVDDFRNGKAYLKVLTPQGIEKMENASISASLQEMGLPAKDEYVAMARKLLQHNLPVTGDNLKSLARGVSMLGGFTGRNLEIATFALARELPLNQQTLLALLQHISPESNVARLVENLIKTFLEYGSKVINQSPIGNPGQPIPGNIAGPSIAGEQQFLESNNLKLISNQVPRQAGQEGNTLNKTVLQEPISLQANIEKPGLNIGESINPRLTIEPVGIAASNRGTAAGASLELTNPGLNPGNIKIGQFLQLLLETSTLDLEGKLSSQIIGDKLQNIIYSERDMIRGLMLLEDILKNNQAGWKNDIITDLMSKIEVYEKELTGQKMLNFVTRMSTDYNLNYYFSFPVTIDNEQKLCQLHISKEPGQKSLKNQDSIKFIVSLDTHKMGMVLFHVHWHKTRQIEIQGVVTSEPVRVYLEHNIRKLLGGLSHLGYTVSNLGLKVARDSDELACLKARLEETPADVKPFSIDITI
ncbi:MAG: hypothetical protein PHT79_12215 [Syntrophomonadaceae bacterium]|nr:hypothetical protein [Syntrophomonadaceae bacterium]